MADRTLPILIDLSPLGSDLASRTGLARVAWSLATALAERDDVELTACAWGSLYASYDFRKVKDITAAIKLREPKFNFLEKAYLDRYINCRTREETVPAWLIRAGQVLNMMRNPLRGLTLEDFSLIHSTYARFTPRISKSAVPRLITLHDLTPFKLSKELLPTAQRQITGRILKSIAPSDHVACVSEHTRQDFLEFSGHPEAQTHVVPNGVDLQRFSVRSKASIQTVREKFGLDAVPYVMTLSSLAPHKNLALILREWAHVRRAVPEARLLIAGGKSKDPLKLKRGLGLDAGQIDESVLMTGFLEDDDLASLLSGCNAFIFPSLYEGFGLPILEAMACGAPVISSNTSSMPEVYGQFGQGLSPLDSVAWREAMIAILNGGNREAPDARVRERAEQFSWESTAGTYIEIYRSISR